MRRERIVLLRSGRHLRVGMDALTTRFPGCHIAVVGTPGSESAVADAGVAPQDYFLYPAPRIEAPAFLSSSTARAVRQWRYDRVAILWNDPKGRGQRNVNLTALAISPFGYVAITPDGTIVERTLGAQACRFLRAVVSPMVGAAMVALLYAPAYVASAFRRLTPRKGASY